MGGKIWFSGNYSSIIFISPIIANCYKLSNKKMINWGGCPDYAKHFMSNTPILTYDFISAGKSERDHECMCCDELIFQTLFHGHEDELNIDGNNALRYINWNKMVPGRRHIGSPLILNEEEYDDIMKSGAFFAGRYIRKFQKDS